MSTPLSVTQVLADCEHDIPEVLLPALDLIPAQAFVDLEGPARATRIREAIAAYNQAHPDAQIDFKGKLMPVAVKLDEVLTVQSGMTPTPAAQENVEAIAGVTVAVNAAVPTALSEPTNPWLDRIHGLTADSRLSTYASNLALTDDIRNVIRRIGRIRQMVLLDLSGLRSAVIGIAQLTADGNSRTKLPMDLADAIYEWWRLVIKGDSRIMAEDERARFAQNVQKLIHPDLESMVYAAASARSGIGNMRAMGAGSTFDVGRFGTLGPSDIAAQIADVVRLAADTVRTTFVLQEYRVFSDEYDMLFKIVEMPSFQVLCGVTPDPTDPRKSVAPALEQAGYPLAAAAFRASVTNEIIFNYLADCPDDIDETYVVGLGEVGMQVIRDNNQVNRVLQTMKEKEVITGAEDAAASFRSAEQHIRAVAAPEPPRGLQFLGLNILVTAEAGIRISRNK